MYRVERAVSKWQRVYTELRAAQQSLRREEAAPPSDSVSPDEDLIAQVDRLQDQEQEAMRAIHDALVAANARAVDGPRPPRGQPPR